MTKKNKQSAPQYTPTQRAAVITELFQAFPEKKYTIKGLTTSTGTNNKEERDLVRGIVAGLLQAGTIEEIADGKYRLKGGAAIRSYEGEVDMTPSGAAYVKVEGLPQDIYIHSQNTGHALHGDQVRVSITRRRRDGSMEGEITDIIARNPKRYVGVVELTPHYAFVKVDSRKIPVDIYIPLHDDTPHLENGEKVLVRIVDWPDNMKSPLGEIVDVFGQAGDNNAEMHAILAEFDLPYHFEPEVEEAAEAIPGEITAQDYAERRDFREVTTFTIDPADAKDFDDALSIRKLGEDRWEVGVHIADVTHYVTPGSVVDTEGEHRATSVYLVDRTVPMLPERLSNELCSLRPHEEKLCFSAVFELDAEAKVLSQWFGRTVILSDRRFTYDEAQALIEGGEGELKEEVLTLDTLAKKLRADRFRHGSIGFEREEVKFTLDETGKPLGVVFKESKDANKLIEEFMLLANRRVAEFVGRKRGRGANAERTFVYRVHDEPNADKLSSFRNFILRFGYTFKAEGGKGVAKEMNKLMSKIRGKKEENVISTLAIRSMAKAVYTTDNIGHYGLAFDYYTHFTSPIRRYPDMMVHRLLAHYLAGGKSVDKTTYEGLCEHCSDMELRAAEAERASIKYKMVEFMLDKLGEEFDGSISGVTEWGIYVELKDTHIEGMVALRDLDDDYYEFDAESYCVRGAARGRTFSLGDEVRIRVLRADLARKQLDFELIGSYDFDTKQLHPIISGSRRAEANPLRFSQPEKKGRSKSDTATKKNKRKRSSR